MTDTAALADCLASHGGLDSADVKLRLRYMREAGILPNAPVGRKGRNKLPQIEAVHAAAALVACVAHGPQIHAAAIVRERWWAPLWRREIGSGHALAAGTALVIDGALPLPCFGEALIDLIEFMAADPSYVPKPDTGLEMMPGNQSRLRYEAVPGGNPAHTDIFLGASSHPAILLNPSHVVTRTSVPAGLLQSLARFVMLCREGARQQGVTIETAEAFEALRFPPEMPAMPLFPERSRRTPEGARDSETLDTTADPESTKAAEGTTPPAAFDETPAMKPSAGAPHNGAYSLSLTKRATADSRSVKTRIHGESRNDRFGRQNPAGHAFA